jgi:hypothetical protein
VFDKLLHVGKLKQLFTFLCPRVTIATELLKTMIKDDKNIDLKQDCLNMPWQKDSIRFTYKDLIRARKELKWEIRMRKIRKAINWMFGFLRGV